MRFLLNGLVKLNNWAVRKSEERNYQNLLEKAISDGLVVTHSGRFIVPTDTIKGNPSLGFIHPFVLAQGTREKPSDGGGIKVGQVYEIQGRRIIASDFEGTLADLVVNFEKRYDPQGNSLGVKGKSIAYKGERSSDSEAFRGEWRFSDKGNIHRGSFELNQVFEERSPNSEYLQARINYWMNKVGDMGNMMAFTRQKGSKFIKPRGSLDSLSPRDMAKAQAQRYLLSPFSVTNTPEEIAELMKGIQYFDENGRQITDPKEFQEMREEDREETDNDFGGDRVYQAIDKLPAIVFTDSKIAAGLGIVQAKLGSYTFFAMDGANDEIMEGYKTTEDATKEVAHRVVKEEERLIT